MPLAMRRELQQKPFRPELDAPGPQPETLQATSLQSYLRFGLPRLRVFIGARQSRFPRIVLADAGRLELNLRSGRIHNVG